MEFPLPEAARRYVAAHLHDDPAHLALQARRHPHLPVPELVRQIQARQKARVKLPTWADNQELIFPPALSVEQASSEQTATYKAALVAGASRLADLTGGFGADAAHFAAVVDHVDYVERNAELAAVVKYNLGQLGIANVTTHAALVGALMPTSHNLIIYSLAAGGKVSIAALILAALVPAAILTISNLAAAYFVAVKRGYPAGTFPGWHIVARSLAAALPGLFVVVLILGGILSGVFTATESAAVAVLYALALTVLLYRTLKWEHFIKAAAKAVKTTGVVLLLIGISSTFGYLISLYGVAELTGRMLSEITTTPWMIFLMINVILFLLGTFLDMAATILLCTPIFLPIAQQYGMSSVQFGIVLLINCALGLNTPPVGTTQFVGCAIGGVSVGTVMRTIWPFYGALIFALGLVTFVPAFSTWLPSMFMVVR